MRNRPDGLEPMDEPLKIKARRPDSYRFRSRRLRHQHHQHHQHHQQSAPHSVGFSATFPTPLDAVALGRLLLPDSTELNGVGALASHARWPFCVAGSLVARRLATRDQSACQMVINTNINIGRRSHSHSRSHSQGHGRRAMIGGAARKIIGLYDKPVLVPDLT